jgi:HEAT repeat protein
VDAPDEDTVDRRAAVAEAGHRGDADAARAGLADADPAVRATALGALRRAGALDGSALGAAIADLSPVVRRRAAEEVAAAGGVEGVSLLPLLDDADPTVVEVAAWASGELDPAEPGAVARLAALVTGHDDALVREAAVAALGAIGDGAGLPAILTATGDKATVRRRAVIALAPFDGPEVDAALHRALDDRDWQVRQAAEDQLR